MLGLDNPVHLAFLFVLLLLVFGAKRLPELGRSLGSGLRGFKESISGESPAAELEPATVAPATIPPAAVAPATVAAAAAVTDLHAAAPAAEPS
jgi:sec-independent protein translocase protein TatA